MAKTIGLEEALGYLRDAVVAGRFQPGDRLDEVEIAAHLETSRIAVHEALGTLAAEGALEFDPGRGYTAPRMSVSTLDQVIRMRDLLEDDLVLAMRRPSADELALLRKSNARAKAAAQAGDYFDYVREIRAFHLQVFALAERPLMVEMVDRLWRMFDPYRALYLYESHDAERSADEDSAILDAAAAGDMERCRSIYRDRRWHTHGHLHNVLSGYNVSQSRTR